MRYGSVCSGIESATVAWHALGWKPAWFCEIDPFCSAVLAHRYPEVRNYGDFTQLLDPAHPARSESPLDALVGGTPCQSFSCAGARQGLADPRGQLMLRYLDLVGVLRPRWIVWENVPGVLSSGGGRDFGALLGGLADLGYGVAYRVLDAQFYGVPQRRRRVFVVGHSGGDAERAAEVLALGEGVRGHLATRGATRKGTATPARRRAARGGGDGGLTPEVAPTLTASPAARSPNVASGEGVVIAERWAPDLAGTLGGSSQAGGFRTTDLDNNGAFVVEPVAFKPAHFTRGKSGAPDTIAPTLQRETDRGDREAVIAAPIAFDTTQITCPENRSQPAPDRPAVPIIAGTVDAHAAKSPERPLVLTAGVVVRRLTPRECERLQGFADDYTRVPWDGGEAPDTRRYKALGNSMAVPVMRWIGARIARVDARR